MHICYFACEWDTPVIFVNGGGGMYVQVFSECVLLILEGDYVMFVDIQHLYYMK